MISPAVSKQAAELDVPAPESDSAAKPPVHTAAAAEVSAIGGAGGAFASVQGECKEIDEPGTANPLQPASAQDPADKQPNPDQLAATSTAQAAEDPPNELKAAGSTSSATNAPTLVLADIAANPAVPAPSPPTSGSSFPSEAIVLANATDLASAREKPRRDSQAHAELLAAAAVAAATVAAAAVAAVAAAHEGVSPSTGHSAAPERIAVPMVPSSAPVGLASKERFGSSSTAIAGDTIETRVVAAQHVSINGADHAKTRVVAAERVVATGADQAAAESDLLVEPCAVGQGMGGTGGESLAAEDTGHGHPMSLAMARLAALSAEHEEDTRQCRYAHAEGSTVCRPSMKH